MLTVPYPMHTLCTEYEVHHWLSDQGAKKIFPDDTHYPALRDRLLFVPQQYVQDELVHRAKKPQNLLVITSPDFEVDVMDVILLGGYHHSYIMNWNSIPRLTYSAMQKSKDKSECYHLLKTQVYTCDDSLCDLLKVPRT